MSTQGRLISDTELEVLKLLWELGEGTVRNVRERVVPEPGRDWAYTTVQTLLNRLQEKGFIESTRQGRAFVFRAVVSRDELLGKSLDSLADRVCDGAALPLLLNLVHSGKFKPEDIRCFRQLLDELDQGE